MSERIPPSSHRLRQMASDYEDAVSEARAEQLAARALARAQRRESAPRRHAIAVVGLASVLFALVGIGYGAAKSLPGDPLYGVSRAAESVGEFVGVIDPVEQRLHEVIALADRGDRARAVQVASEALDELGRSGVNVALPPIVSLTSSTTTTSTTAAGGVATTEGTSPTVAPAETSATTAAPAPPTTEALAIEDPEEDPIVSLRVAAELLLNRVKENGGELEDAAADLAAAVSSLTDEEDTSDIEGDDTTTSSTSSTTSTTTTTVPADDETTSTTEPGSSSTSSTSTTLVDGGDEEDGDEDAGEGRGPIFLPPAP